MIGLRRSATAAHRPLKPLKITIWGINYAPEATGIAPYNTDLCDRLASMGHTPRMVTSFSYYPAWQKLGADHGRLYRTDLIATVPVHRCWCYVPKRPTAFRRMLHEASFVAASFFRLLFLPRPDAIIAISPPLLLGPAAWLLSLLKRCPFFFHVQDMQPDAAIQMGMLRPGLLTRILYGLERFTYRRACAISGIAPGMLELLREKEVPEEKIIHFPNWIRSPTGPEPEPGEFRYQYGISPDEFLVVYSGNLGRKQGIEILLEASELLGESRPTKDGVQPHPIRIIIAGDGAEREALAESARRKKLRNVRLLPLQSERLFRAMLQDADLCVVTQRKGSGSLFFPSKLLTLVAAGRPVLTVADPEGELAQAARTEGMAINVATGDASGLATEIARLADCPGELKDLAEAGVRWSQQFARESVISAYLTSLAARLGSDWENRPAETPPPLPLSRPL
jgi:colanic acid biosynthesis glycosyl transferase WcaI